MVAILGYNQLMRRKRLIIIGFIVFVIILTICSVLLALRNPFGEEMTIANLSSQTKGRPLNRNTLQLIQHDLYNTIRQNYTGNVRIADNSLSDILVRDGSYSESYNQQTKTHSVSFIVDIASIKQSYRVSYIYSSENNVNESGENQYDNAVHCLPQDQMIYGYFYCNDVFTQMNNSNTPRLSINWASTDESGNTVFGQLENSEIDYISTLTFDHHRKNHKLTRMDTPSVLRNISRNVSAGHNSLSFTLVIDGVSEYRVTMDYQANRTITIQTMQGKHIATSSSSA